MTSLAYIHDCHSCYDERSIDQKKKVSHPVSWVSFWLFWFGFGWALVFVCFVCFVLEDSWLFTLIYSPTCGNGQSKTIRLDDRLSLERARHELKKAETLRAVLRSSPHRSGKSPNWSIYKHI